MALENSVYKWLGIKIAKNILIFIAIIAVAVLEMKPKILYAHTRYFLKANETWLHYKILRESLK